MFKKKCTKQNQKRPQSERDKVKSVVLSNTDGGWLESEGFSAV